MKTPGQDRNGRFLVLFLIFSFISSETWQIVRSNYYEDFCVCSNRGNYSNRKFNLFLNAQYDTG